MASSTAYVRYGFAPESIERTSTRAEPVLPGLYIGTRIRAERLLWPQQMYEGPAAGCRMVRPPPPQMRL